jgi:hypothetical protein
MSGLACAWYADEKSIGKIYQGSRGIWCAVTIDPRPVVNRFGI